MSYNLLYRIFHLRSYAFYRLSPVATLAPTDTQITLHRLDENDFKASEIFQDQNRAEKFIARLLDQHICYGVRCNTGQVIAYFWVSDFSSYKMRAPLTFGIQMSMPEEYIYIWDCRTAPSYQGKEIYQTGLRVIREIYANRVIIINAERHNTPSLKGIQKAGFSLCGYLSALLLLQKLTLVWGTNKKLNINPKIVDMTVYLSKEGN